MKICKKHNLSYKTFHCPKCKKITSKKYYSTEEHMNQKKEADRLYYNKNKDHLKEKSRTYAKNNRESINKYKREKRRSDPKYKLSYTVSVSINKMIISNGGSKNGNSIRKYLPYTIEQLKQYLEFIFEPWMSWDNRGPYSNDTWDDNDSTTWTWNIDHIIPQSKLPYDSLQHPNFQKCWALENLRPYSAKQNILDGNRRKVA